jgi:hypothetical protein
MPLNIPNYIQFILVALLTGIGCFAFYDLVIRRIWFLRPLFGLKIVKVKKVGLSKHKGRSINGNEKPLDKAG